MGSKSIVEVDSIFDFLCCVLTAFEAMPMNALLLKCANDAFDHSIMLRTVGRYEFLAESVASDKTGVIEASKNQSIV